MFLRHSLLWDYLWVAPNVLLFGLGIFLLRRGLHRSFPAFLAFAFFGSLAEVAAYLADIIHSVSPENFWRVIWLGLLGESLLKFLILGEVFSRLFSPYPSIARLGKSLVSGSGAVLVLVAAVFAALAKGDSVIRIIATAHLLEQTVFIVESGLIISLFVFAGYFRLSWDRPSLGILLGLGISSCEHLATWAIIANTSPSENIRTLLAFLNMATYHVSVLVWMYYFLVPRRVRSKPTKPPKSAPPKPPNISLPENNLDVWNRELERLLQQ
jgi:hypothetical protein